MFRYWQVVLGKTLLGVLDTSVWSRETEIMRVSQSNIDKYTRPVA